MIHLAAFLGMELSNSQPAAKVIALVSIVVI